MSEYQIQLQQRIDAAVAANDEAALDQILEEHYRPADSTDQPFDAAIEIQPDKRGLIEEPRLEGAAALNWANRISRAKRLVAYRLKLLGGFSGTRVVSEGDSWWQYPLRLQDVIDHLNEDSDIAVRSLGAAGDLVEHMARRKEYLTGLQETGARVLLLSGGGNDIFGNKGIKRLIVDDPANKDPRDMLDTRALGQAVRGVLGHYKTVLSDVSRAFPGVQVFGHAYDLPHPEQGGKWLGGPLGDAKVPKEHWRSVIAILLDRFSKELSALESEFGNFTFVDLRGTVDRGRQSWFDELHPHNAGFGRAAAAFRDAVFSTGVPRTEGAVVYPPPYTYAPQQPSPLEAEPTALEAAKPVIVLDPGHGGSPPPSKVGGSSWNNAIGPNGTLEKVLTLDVANRTAKFLQHRGRTVFLTRVDDRNLSLRARAGIAKARNAEVFVSIHFNASNGHNAQGTETFVHPSQGPKSERLCRALQRVMVATLGHRDRNAEHRSAVKYGNFGVIDLANHAPRTACALHEVSFLDRYDEEKRLNSATYRDRIAKALADGIEVYLGVGLEGMAFEVDEGLGDAIEAAAAEQGLPVPAYLLGVGEPEGGNMRGDRHVGGDVLADEANSTFDSSHLDDATFDANSFDGEAGNDLDLIGSIIGSEDRYRSKPDGQDEEANDLREFAEIEIGEGFDFATLGKSFEADREALAPMFGNLETSGFDMHAFSKFIENLGLHHFSPAEFLMMGSSNAPGGRCVGLNRLPAPDLWPNIARTARMLDKIRGRLGAPVRILSAYRSPRYNSCVGGSSGSLHRRFNALDWRCSAGSVHDWHRAAMEVRESDRDFLGGIGLYVRSRFVHIDTRDKQADW